MSDGLRFEVNGKIVNLASVIDQARPIYDPDTERLFPGWPIGEVLQMDRLGFMVYGRNPSREDLSGDDLWALVTFYAMKANRKLTPADMRSMSFDEFTKVSAAFVEAFVVRLLPPKKAPMDGMSDGSPASSSGGIAAPSTPSGDSATGDPPTSTG